MIKTLLNPNHVLSDCDNLEDIDAQRMAAVLGKHLYGFKKGEEKPIVKVLGLDANDDVRWSASSVPGGGLPPSTPEDEGKVLVVGDDGQPEWADIPSGHGETLYSIDSASQGNWNIDSTYAIAQFYLGNDGDNQGVEYQLDASDRKAGYKLEVDHVYQVNYNCEVVSSNQTGKVWEGSIYTSGAQSQNWYFQLDGSQNLGLSLTGSTIVHCTSASNDVLYFNARLNGSYYGSLPTMSLTKVSIVDLTSIGGSGGGTEYQAGNGIDISGDTISVDTTEIQEKLTAGPNITISNNNIVSTDKTVVAAGNNVSVTSSYEPSTRTVTYTVHSAGGSGTAIQSNWAEQDPLEPSYIQNKPQNLVQDADYVHTDNNFTTTEKLKLDGIQAGAEANVQADWNETNTDSDAYIKNKPTIPAGVIVDQTYDATSTNAQSGTAVAEAVAGVNAVPSSTSADENKVLTVDSNGDAVWANAQGGNGCIVLSKANSTQSEIITAVGSGQPVFLDCGNTYTSFTNAMLPYVSTFTDSSSGSSKTYYAFSSVIKNYQAGAYLQYQLSQIYNATDGRWELDAVTNLDAIRSLPSAGVGYAGRVLTVSSSGYPQWSTASTVAPVQDVTVGGTSVVSSGTAAIPAQVQSNWTESDSNAKSYIQNKPTEKALIAGTGITITETAQGFVISLTQGT